MNELDKIDLELFKACGFRRQTLEELPKSERHPANIRWIGRNDNMVIMRPQFTKDIGACFQFLIPEMNRRGWYYTVSYDPSFQCHEAMFWNEDAQDFKATDDNNVAEAVSKAAYAALKGEGVAK